MKQEKNRNELVLAIYDKEGVISKKLAESLNVDKFFVDRIDHLHNYCLG